MKWMEIILRYYLFALMLFPCGDEQVQMDMDSSGSIFITQQDDHQSHDQHDDCSPLCVCHCCHLHYVIYDNTDIQFLNPYFSLNRIYQLDIPEEQIEDFLKPPKQLIS